MDYDLIVIGGGTAGLNAAKAAHKLGVKLAIVEAESFAGTCLLRG
jgi:pyruvate/2-oxoglutarate dehydrogenase complex dihydrolipoamide dehydrogenase (E3) component